MNNRAVDRPRIFKDLAAPVVYPLHRRPTDRGHGGGTVGEQQRRRFIAGQTDFNSRLETVLTVESATLAVYLVIFTSRYDAFGNAGSRTDRLPPSYSH